MVHAFKPFDAKMMNATASSVEGWAEMAMQRVLHERFGPASEGALERILQEVHCSAYSSEVHSSARYDSRTERAELQAATSPITTRHCGIHH